MRHITILYEDSRAQASGKRYGPHELVKQCVCDRLALDYWHAQIKKLHGIPKRGNGAVRKECSRIPQKIGRDGSYIFAVYDDDKVREMIGLPFTSCKETVRTKLEQECSFPKQLVVVLLNRNIETLLEAVRECAPQIADQELWENAIRHKDLIARDSILCDVAKPTLWAREIRNAVLTRVPSLDYLVSKIAVILEPPSEQPNF